MENFRFLLYYFALDLPNESDKSKTVSTNRYLTCNAMCTFFFRSNLKSAPFGLNIKPKAHLKKVFALMLCCSDSQKRVMRSNIYNDTIRICTPTQHPHTYNVTYTHIDSDRDGDGDGKKYLFTTFEFLKKAVDGRRGRWAQMRCS